MESKNWLDSKTVWFGIAQVVFGLVGVLMGWIDNQTSMSLITTGIGTIGFRAVTTMPIK